MNRTIQLSRITFLLVASACVGVAQATHHHETRSMVKAAEINRTPMETIPAFQSALPIWPQGRETEKNVTVAFRTSFVAHSSKIVILRAAGSTVYRIFLNGDFLDYGPARGPHGWFRVDELDITRKLKPGRNVVAFEVAGYNVNSFYLIDQPSFLQAEIVADGKVLTSTGTQESGFEAGILDERVQKVQRYSFQRPFSEIYHLLPGCDQWRSDVSVPLASAKCSKQPTIAFLPRRVPFCKFDLHSPRTVVSKGSLVTGAPIANPWKDRSLTGIGAQLGGFFESELASIPSIELQAVSNTSVQPLGQPYVSSRPIQLLTNEFQIVDLGVNLTGFIGATIHCQTKTRLDVTFDEILTKGDVDFKRLGCVNVVSYEFEPGTYKIESFEPYTLRYLKLQVREGACDIRDVSLRDYVSPIPTDAHFSCSDDRLNRLFAAGVETFHQNAVDVFMDCPSRERAGWLCDSFFTARVAKELTGNSLIEKNLFENYRLPEKFKFLPDGMLPMCYPSDHNDGVFIPNWAMWFVVELEEYLARSGDKQTVKALEPRLMKLLDYFKRFRNSDGLLEKLESWVFIEWSDANGYVQDVNYPTNMLYAEVLASMGRMYGRSDLLADAEKVRSVIRKQSFDGSFFVDNAIRRDGKLEVTKNHSEVCQYFAFFFHLATPETHPMLWKTLVSDFGPKRKQTHAYPQVHSANAFVGNVLRLELLSRAGLTQQLLDESLAYQLYMVDLTGTLWENDGAYASCNHGFASHGGVCVPYRDILGLASVDTVHKKIRLRFTDLKLERCEGSVPTPDGKLSLTWHRDDSAIHYHVSAPKGYNLEVENRSQLKLISE